MEKMENCDLSTTEMRNKITFLESLVSQYEVLVNDMSKELVECKEDLRKLTKIDEKGESKFVSTDSGAGDGHVSCDNCKNQERRIENLFAQLEWTKKSGEIQQTLWKACMEQLETCEQQKLSRHLSLQTQREEKSHFRFQPPQQVPIYHQMSQKPVLTIEDLFTKWKLLQIYSTGLEERIESTVAENKMYRKRLLEIKLENEVNLKKQAVQRVNDIESTKNSFRQEIEYWKQSAEKLRKEFSETFEKRIEKEREIWKSEETERQRAVLMKMESTIADSEVFVLRETQMSIQLREIAKELLITRKKLESAQQELCRVKFSIPTSNNYPEKMKNTSGGSTPILKSTSQQTQELQLPDLKQLQEMKTQMIQLQDEYTKLCDSKSILESESQKQLSTAIFRVKELELLCRKLEAELLQCETDKIKARKDLEECMSQAKNKQCDEIKEIVSSTAAVNSIMPITESFSPTILDVQRLEEKRRQVREMSFIDHIQMLERERDKLIRLLEKQKSVAKQWQKEYNQLIETLHTT